MRADEAPATLWELRAMMLDADRLLATHLWCALYAMWIDRREALFREKVGSSA